MITPRSWLAGADTRDTIWKRGERAAARVMKRAGCRVLARNLRVGRGNGIGEIDLLCRDRRDGTFVIVEVKARRTSGDGARRPEDAVTNAKKSKLLTLARALRREERVRGHGIRIDVVAVEFAPGRRRPAAVRHYERAVSAG